MKKRHHLELMSVGRNEVQATSYRRLSHICTLSNPSQIKMVVLKGSCRGDKNQIPGFEIGSANRKVQFSYEEVFPRLETYLFYIFQNRLRKELLKQK